MVANIALSPWHRTALGSLSAALFVSLDRAAESDATVRYFPRPACQEAAKRGRAAWSAEQAAAQVQVAAVIRNCPVTLQLGIGKEHMTKVELIIDTLQAC